MIIIETFWGNKLHYHHLRRSSGTPENSSLAYNIAWWWDESPQFITYYEMAFHNFGCSYKCN